jgi:ElaB/YqjD/DUF883 family membrane-anchored ribosome-binding protein
MIMTTYTATKDSTLAEPKAAGRARRNEVYDTESDAKRDIADLAQDAGQKVRRMFDIASEEISHAGDVVSNQIRTKPVQSSLIALASGFVLGALLRR